MILKKLGPDSVEELDALTQADWVAYIYKIGDYEGDGDAYWFMDGKLYYKNLSHCSCFGPADTGYGMDDDNAIPDNMEQFVIDKSLVLSDNVLDAPHQNSDLLYVVTQLLTNPEYK